MSGVTTVLLLVVLATAVATGARHWSIPAPSLLVVAGVLVGLLPFVPRVVVPPEVISVAVLPPLLYASAEEISWRELKAVWRPVTVLALGLVLASAFTVGALAAALTPLPPAMAFVLGAVLASTDPVAVTALGRRLPLPARVQTLVQSESLFNDATSLVLFKVAVGLAVAAGSVSPVAAGGEFLLLAGGGALVGLAVAGLVAAIRTRTEDPVLETVIALVTPYAAYVLGEDLHTSGVTAVVVAGVALGAQGYKLTSGRTRLQVHAVYRTVVFMLESVVFAIIGLELPGLIHELDAAEGGWFWQALLIALAVILIRLLWIFPTALITQRQRATAGGPGLNWRVPAVMTWAGTRGVMPLAAALTIPLLARDGTPLPYRTLVLVLTTAVVACTLVVQGFTLAPVVRASGIALEPEATAREEARAAKAVLRTALERLDSMVDAEAVQEALADRMRRDLEARLDHARMLLSDEEPPEDEATVLAYRRLRRDLIELESEELRRLYDERRISEATRATLQHALDLEEAGLGEL
ncbi:Na+/H+ antiporter [Kitasatospora kifunensis]|uniref:CPA1 family monovalent cation:H+ antiporter n=1 Tax=Kitasatospora kifunensis TaxID=58351 RepID=A0A7W7R700_KITKI|nr:Na+/H+ antiporter [Kitasatospora kifunensis]MBB4926582.1 CPA1 family monovalent cation:H+ antiporter [Kitasatospora kifunensis]